MLDHRAEVEFDFRAVLHVSFAEAARTDEGWRLLRMLLRRPDSEVFAAEAGWHRPLSVDSFLLASLFTAWTGSKHPLMPDASDAALSEADTRVADAALDRMNGGGR